MFKKNIIAGDTLLITDMGLPFDPTSGNSVTVFLNGPTLITIAAATITGTYTISVASTITRSWPAGTYDYAVVANLAGEETTLASGQVEVDTRIDLQQQGDKRSHARRVLDNINAVIEKRATSDQQSYSIDGRSLSRMTLVELLTFKNHYQSLANAESGKSKKTIITRM